MSIFIVGPDKAGKTTLAKQIAEHADYPYVHFDKPPKGFGREHVMFEYGAVKNICLAGAELVIDRGIWCEMVYGKIYRGLEMDLAAVRQFEAGLESTIIYCSDTVDNICKRMAVDADEWVRPDTVQQIMDLYEEVLRDSKLDVIRLTPIGMNDHDWSWLFISLNMGG